jgi:hypothetical protein
MQILTRNNRNFQKSSRNPSYRTKVKILKKNIFLDSSSKKFGSAYAQSPRKCSNIEILAKIEGKEGKYVQKFTKKSKLSHACVPLKSVFVFESVRFVVFQTED